MQRVPWTSAATCPRPTSSPKFSPGRTTRDQVVKILGTPSSTGVFNDKSWYYISRKTKQVAFFNPDVLDQQVYVVNFDGNGVVASVDHKDLKDGREIEPAPGATPAPGRELTFLEQMLGNIGRFNKSERQLGRARGQTAGTQPARRTIEAGPAVGWVLSMSRRGPAGSCAPALCQRVEVLGRGRRLAELDPFDRRDQLFVGRGGAADLAARARR